MPDVRRDLVNRVVREVAAGGLFILRGNCAELEAELSERSGRAHTVVVSSTTAAYLLALLSDGLEPADAVDAPAGVHGVLRRLGAIPTAGPQSTARWTVRDGQITRAGQAVASVVDLGPGSPYAGITQAAAVQTDDADLAMRVRMLRNHGQDGRTRFLHHLVGFNARMDEIGAAYLLATMRPGSARTDQQ